MFGSEASLADPVRVGLIGAGRIGASHATLLARRVSGARMTAIADPRPGVAQRLADPLGCRAVDTAEALFADADIEAVGIAASSPGHAQPVVAAPDAGQAGFFEKPMGVGLDEM